MGDKFDTSNVVYMHGMFEGCELPECFSLGNKFDTSNVIDIDYVFCSDSDLSTRLGKSSSYVNVYRRAGLSYEEIIVKALHLKG